jgi:predicted tellurium resistance membrane protein TerC
MRPIPITIVAALVAATTATSALGVVSQGAFRIGADAMWASGIDGAGQTVAVLDQGFDGLDRSIAAGELPPIDQMTVKSFDAVNGITGKDQLEAPTEHGVRMATPLFVGLLLVELSDVIFAVDSVPAIFALTNEPFIVFTSNVFAILGLRSLFFVLQSMVQAFRFLKYGLGVILLFVGAKMVWLNEAFDGKFPIAWSLAIIGAIIAVSILASIVANRFKPA